MGGPAVVAPTRRGFGSTIIEQSVPFDLGGKAAIEYRLTGFHAEFCVPARHVAGTAKGEAETTQPARAVGDGKPLQGKSVLLVEDSMIIALDAEDVLTGLGAARVAIAASVADALDRLANETFSFALLDVNLGPETSVAVAERLRALNTPFAFATGYGDSAVFLRDYKGIAVVNKPYGELELRKIFDTLVLP